ncbi:hypothetical protein RBB80_15135 [Tunturiibacter gelidiferens]
MRVGGPSTAQAAYVGDFLQHCKDHNIPVDFASTHVYANDTAKDVFHTDEQIPRDVMVYRAVKKCTTRSWPHPTQRCRSSSASTTPAIRTSPT